MSHYGSTYFIADLHLDPERQQALEFSLTFFEQLHGAKALYILGDLFEYWIGDDAGLALYPEVTKALASLSSSGCQITVMHGNRDFLLGEAFAVAIGAQLVRQDEWLITLGNEPALLMHGDTLCTDDTDYQSLRTQLRDPSWQQQFLSKSIEERLSYAAHLREQSREKSAGKSVELMDVNQREVESVMAKHPCNVLIHGHTHRPKRHTDTSSGACRLVLGDWHPDHAYYAVSDHNGLQLKNFLGQLDTPAPSA